MDAELFFIQPVVRVIFKAVFRKDIAARAKTFLWENKGYSNSVVNISQTNVRDAGVFIGHIWRKNNFERDTKQREFYRSTMRGIELVRRNQ